MTFSFAPPGFQGFFVVLGVVFPVLDAFFRVFYPPLARKKCPLPLEKILRTPMLRYILVIIRRCVFAVWLSKKVGKIFLPGGGNIP